MGPRIRMSIPLKPFYCDECRVPGFSTTSELNGYNSGLPIALLVHILGIPGRAKYGHTLRQFSISSSCYKKTTIEWVACNKCVPLTDLKAGKYKIKVLADSGKNLLLGLLMTPFCFVLTWLRVERDRASSGVSSSKGTFPIMT